MSVKERILEAGVSILHEQGIAGITGPRVAREAGVSQSHLTYYFPTRDKLLMAIANRSVDTLIGLFEAADVGNLESPFQRTSLSPLLISQTRVMAGLLVAADTDPELRSALNELVMGFRVRLAKFLPRFGIEPTENNVLMMHANLVGLAVMNFARQTEDSIKDFMVGMQNVVTLLHKDSNATKE
ncbi:MAG TPA: TetR/AcrR family transcriptional regulator [Pseudomonadales bacterium]|nr:TetR/AcrR family transcriptional regulator [Pseudomonadales bacterium]